MNIDLSLSVLLATISILLSIYFSVKNRKFKRLDIVFEPPISLVKVDSNMKPSVEIKYRNTQVSELSLQTIQITCSGNQAIRPSDFEEEAIPIALPASNLKLIEATFSNPQFSRQSAISPNSDGLMVKLKAMNPGDTVRINLLLDGFPSSSLVHHAKVIDGSIRVLSAPGRTYLKEALILLVGFSVLTTAFYQLLYYAIREILKANFEYYGPKMEMVNITITTITSLLLSVAITQLYTVARRLKKSLRKQH